MLVLAARAGAQPPAQPSALPRAVPRPTAPTAPKVLESTTSDTHEATNNQQNHHFIGHFEYTSGDTSIYADDAWFYTEDNRFEASGNVLFTQGTGRISAERVVFNTDTKLGTFYTASGIATVKPPVQTARPGGIAPPPVVGQENVVYFFGETVEKVGPKKYKITRGGFSTCVQPTPRWDLHAGTVVLNIDHYTLLTQAVLRVKGVPMFYLPILIYPTKQGDRATGFLIPTYGSSTLRGQTFHNAFFWAVNRSQDLTLAHDWFSKTGQGVGSEYRYNLGAAGDGNIRGYMLDQHDAIYAQPNGTDLKVNGSRSYEFRGSANQLLPWNLRAQGRVDYFSSIVTSQTFNTNINDSSRNTRSFGGNLIGAWSEYTLNGTFDHREYFPDATSSVLAGTWPRLAFQRNEKQLLGSAVYVSVAAEYTRQLSTSRTPTVTIESGLDRIDLFPQIRYPFKKWQWFTVNSTVSWRDTYYSRSYAPTGDPLVRPSVITDASLNRRFVSLQSQILGPVFNRIWDTPENGYAEKFKHSIEPFVNIVRTSAVDGFDRVVQFDGIDAFVGGTTYTYGLNNRFYAKSKLTPSSIAQSREIVSVELTQSYYTDQRAAIYDRQYQTNSVAGSTDAPPTHFSPISLNVRTTPTPLINATFRAEFDSRYHAVRTLSASTTYSWGTFLQATGGWSKRGYIPQLAGFNDAKALDQSLNGSSTVRTKDNKFGGTYALSYDILRSTLLQQGMTGFYNAQCCGLAFQYQVYNYGSVSSPIPSDRRFFLSFTLAGLGNFSPMNGALGGVPR